MRTALRSALRHPVTVIGMVITTVMAVLFISIFLLTLFGYVDNPYIGLLLFAVIPVAFATGLLMIPIGLRLDVRRRRRMPDAPPADWPVLDLRRTRQRRLAALVVFLTAANLVILSIASYGAVHYMETPQFCGLSCHSTMEPQYVAHQNGPHANIPCVACHVGPGAAALLRSKMTGMRQLWLVATGNVPKPVLASVHVMRPARETCENCHWPEKLHGEEVRVFREYADDEKNTETVTTMTLFVGGGSAKLGIGTGIHWHMNIDNQIEYIATDPKREVIPYVRLRDRTGTVKEFVTPGTTPEQLAAGERRQMDCLDCHSRPAHAFPETPERAVNEAMANGRIPKELPFVRREAFAAVSQEYQEKQAALDGIAARLRTFYKANPSVDARLVDRAIAGAQDVWARNVFPAMNVKWGTYRNQISHIDSPGCFRCHDDEHTAKDGTVIRQRDCEICHKESE